MRNFLLLAYSASNPTLSNTELDLPHTLACKWVNINSLPNHMLAGAYMDVEEGLGEPIGFFSKLPLFKLML